MFAWIIIRMVLVVAVVNHFDTYNMLKNML